MLSPRDGHVCSAELPESSLEAEDAAAADSGGHTKSKETGDEKTAGRWQAGPEDRKGESASRQQTSLQDKKGAEKEEEPHWIGIKLKDDEGKPVPFEEYRVKLSNGTIISGKLDQAGTAKVENIPDGGEAEVKFPRFHESEVSKQ